MSQRVPLERWLVVLACALIAASAILGARLVAADEGMAHMAGHMYMTALRPSKPGDQRRRMRYSLRLARRWLRIRTTARRTPTDIQIFLPNIPQSQYHFTNYLYALEARTRFDPLKPTSLLYKKTADGGYRLVGAMYTDRVDSGEQEIDDRIPLSIARWHQHVNFCKAPAGRKAEYFGPDAKFGLLGSITTPEACEAAGGKFHPHIFGWMVHVYPFEKDPKNIWSTMDDDEGHDNMDHSSMPGMKME